MLPVLFVKLPPAPPSDHTADVAPPPNDPPNAVEVPPWHIAAMTPPTFTVGVGFTVRVLVTGATEPHEPPLAVNVKVTEDGAVADAV